MPEPEATFRFGFVTAPVNPPPSLAFPAHDVASVPWNRASCSEGAEASHLLGEATASALDWAGQWTDKTVVGAATACAQKLWNQTSTLAAAVLRCDADFQKDCTGDRMCRLRAEDRFRACTGLSSAAPTPAILQGGKHTFWGCGAGGTVASESQTTYMKKNSAMPAMLPASGPSIKVSFQPTGSPLVHRDGAPAAEYLVEDGQLYGPRGDGKPTMGFRCQSGVSTADAFDNANSKLEDEGWMRSVESTYAQFADQSCPDGEQNAWELELEPGVYKVTTTHEWGDHYYRPLRYFVVEGVRKKKSNFVGLTFSNELITPPISTDTEEFEFLDVLDGKLTLQVQMIGERNKFYINTVEVTKVGQAGTKTPAWTPTAENPWWQLRFDSGPEPVGVVELVLPGRVGPIQPCLQDHATCLRYHPWRVNAQDPRAWWLFRAATSGVRGGGDLKNDTSMPSGPFAAPGEGAVVSLANSSCTETGGCPVGHVCSVIKCVALGFFLLSWLGGLTFAAWLVEAPTLQLILHHQMASLLFVSVACRYAPNCGPNAQLQDQDNMFVRDGDSLLQCPLEVNHDLPSYVLYMGPFVLEPLCNPQVDCQGAVGSHLRIQLPGEGRIFAAQVRAFRSLPKVQDDVLACFGVEARRPSAVAPEYVVSGDPEDMTFYSTCYVRESVVDWLPTGKERPQEPAGFVFNECCVSCDDYRRNAAEASSVLAPRRWTLDPRCTDCDRLLLNSTVAS